MSSSLANLGPHHNGPVRHPQDAAAGAHIPVGPTIFARAQTLGRRRNWARLRRPKDAAPGAHIPGRTDHLRVAKMVGRPGIEPGTNRLKGGCSTTELAARCVCGRSAERPGGSRSSVRLAFWPAPSGRVPPRAAPAAHDCTSPPSPSDARRPRSLAARGEIARGDFCHRLLAFPVSSQDAAADYSRWDSLCGVLALP